MRIKRLILTVVLICFALGSTGCGEALYTMTEEEETVVTLYAAKMVSKFNKNQTIGVCNARVRPGELDDGYGTTAEENIDEPQEVAPEVIPNQDNLGETDNSQQDVSLNFGYSLTEVIGISGMEFSLDSFEVMNEYKASDYFVLTAGSGKKYLVLHFTGKNTSDAAIELDMGSVKGTTYKLYVNGAASATAQKTVLLEDLSSYFGTVSAGEEKEFVLIFQFSDSQVEDVSSIALEVTLDGITKATSF
ncbi:MAG: hypothetical protein HUJ71_06965 [Pseudobutyrivibrio sp.]|nr:hypothetical protein [Pseudobutyrivibrio sp.]